MRRKTRKTLEKIERQTGKLENAPDLCEILDAQLQMRMLIAATASIAAYIRDNHSTVSAVKVAARRKRNRKVAMVDFFTPADAAEETFMQQIEDDLSGQHERLKQTMRMINHTFEQFEKLGEE